MSMRNRTQWFPTVALVGVLFLPLQTGNCGNASTVQPAQEGQERPAPQEDPERAITTLIRQMQMDLEASSSRAILSHIDEAQFDDYPRFQDMIERLSREDILRVYFRQVSHSAQEQSAQTILDAEMELTRKDAAGAPERRRQQLVIDFSRTSRGWKIINITPREFFRPL